MTPGAEVAIIGFWKRENEDDPNSEFQCYFYFNCANIKKREVRKSERKESQVSAKQVLYTSQVDGKEIVFFFYQDHDSQDDMLAILDCMPKRAKMSMMQQIFNKTSTKYLPPIRNYFKIKDKEIKKTLGYLGFKKIDTTALIQNPQLIKGFEPDLGATNEAGEDQQKANQYTLVFVVHDQTHKIGPLIFYNLNLEKVVKEIKDGKAFISYSRAKEPQNQGTLIYMSDLNERHMNNEILHLP